MSKKKTPMVEIETVRRLHLNTKEEAIELWLAEDYCIHATCEGGKEIQLTENQDDANELADWFSEAASCIGPSETPDG